MSSDRSTQSNRRLVAGHQWGLQLQREMDVLVAATKGQGLCTLILALATEAVIADNGTLVDSSGEPGYAWNPRVYEGKSADPVTGRIRAAGGSLGRVLAGGHPSHRTYLAFLEALYVVTTQQEYDVAERIEKLWDESQAMVEQEIEEEEQRERPRPSTLRRLWTYIKVHWLLLEEPEQPDDEE